MIISNKIRTFLFFTPLVKTVDYMDLALTCLLPKEFEKLKEMISKYTYFYENREDPWIKGILGRLNNVTIKECKKDDLKRMIYIIDMWNFSGIKKSDDDFEKIISKLKIFYAKLYQESVFK